VPAPTTVWAVELGRESALAEIKGSLSLTSDALVFTPRDDKRPPVSLAFAGIAKAKRLRGSPVLMVTSTHDGTVARMAFYFVQPPPLDRPEPTTTRPTPFGVGRSTKRKARRQNVSYLGAWNSEKKELLREWERQVRERIGAG
jgi:hypothetical protein